MKIRLGIVYGHMASTLLFVTKPKGPRRVLKYSYIYEWNILLPKYYVEFEEGRTEWTVDEFI